MSQLSQYSTQELEEELRLRKSCGKFSFLKERILAKEDIEKIIRDEYKWSGDSLLISRESRVCTSGFDLGKDKDFEQHIRLVQKYPKSPPKWHLETYEVKYKKSYTKRMMSMTPGNLGFIILNKPELIVLFKELSDISV